MTAVALLILPSLALMLIAMDRLEDRMYRSSTPHERPGPARHARPRHLRLLPPLPEPAPSPTPSPTDEPAHGDRPDAA